MLRFLVCIFLQIFVFQLHFVFAQVITKETGEGRYVGNKSQSIEHIEKKALQFAKMDALANSGIKEYIKTTSTRRTETNSSTSDSENISFSKTFTSSFFSEMQGAVTEYEIINQEHSINEYDFPVYYVKIRATVIEYKNDADNNFKAVIDGLEPSYSYDQGHAKDGCVVRFNFQNTKDSYLTLFAVWGDSVAVVYPNDNEDQFNSRNAEYKFKKAKKHFFGEENNDYWFDSNNKKSTIYSLIFVFHKQERLFIEYPNMDNMLKWIYEIPRDLRYIDIKDFTVHNKSKMR